VYTGGHVNQGSDPDGDGTYDKLTRATIRFDARSETELGTLRSYIETRFNYTNGSNSGGLIPNAFTELGGFRIGVADELFGSFTGYAGSVINDDVINYQSGTS
ncbi:porin, partial [Escherichia coli]|uniref:porin n=1 Tax=Escherichia coli TaxID=562 RepID=UPI001EDB61EF